MSEKRIMELSDLLARKQISQANLKREKGSASEIVRLEAEIVSLKREINQELLQLSKEAVDELDVETDDTQRNR
ncbi:MAG: hypothetical protein V1924_04515 [Candidatus Bathyarchaeota archaeon]